ncbi:MAG: peptide deformylase [Desulfovibrionaceae bacterium]|nr:peptide deformylase [Desulfovibrionaceae bacterium]
MLLDILVYPDPRLKTVCEPIKEVTPELRQLVKDMFETMYDASGVGLAAPQIGQFIRMLVMDPQSNKEVKAPRVLINPELELYGEDIKSKAEGCLSVPLQYRADVIRKNHVHLKARDLDWNMIEEDLEGYPAIIVQHEFDHLNGILFIDHIMSVKRALFDGKVRRWQKRHQ